MTTLRWLVPVLALAALPALAQRRPGAPIPPGPGQRSYPFQRMQQPAGQTPPAPQPPPAGPRNNVTPPPGRERQIAPRPGAAPGMPVQPLPSNRPVPSCEEVRKNAKYGIYFDKVDIEKLVQTVSDATCKTFILPENVRGKISIIGPENGKVEVNAEQFYAAFLAALDANNLSVYPYGKFLKIVDKNAAKQTPIPVVGPNEPYSTNEEMLTKMFRLKYVDADQMRGLVQQLVTRGGDAISFPPDTLIVNDNGANLHRLEGIIRQLDARSSSDELQIIQIKYASVQDVANTIQKLFEAKGKGPGGSGPVNRPYNYGGTPPPPSPNPAVQQAGETQGASRGPVVLTTLIPDERTNKLIVMASPAAIDRIQDLLVQIDVPISGEGRINVYYLENANAEDMASTLQGLAQGTANRPRTGGPGGAPHPAAGGPAGAATAELFSGEVKISADKATNSLVIVANQGDFRNLVRVIQKLDKPRNQVFVEAVIMEVNLDHSTDFGINVHQGFSLHTPEGTSTGLIGTKYTTSGLPPSFSLTNLASFGGFLAGLQGPVIPELAKLGINIPSFGIVLHALQQSSDVNVLSTPHLLTSDNEEAEITVGQNVPFQAGFSPSSLSSALGSVPPTGSTGSAGGIVSGLGLGGALGGLGSYYAPINRQNVELKLTIKPQINSGNFVRLVINESTEEIASSDPVLGPTTSKRSAKTTVVAKDQETVVIGGIMQDRTIRSVSKVPILGDLPILGHLFREQSVHKVKTNLLLFLTPYIIRDQSDFRRIFERKLAERQQFVEQFYGDMPGYEVAVDYDRKGGPFAKINDVIIHEEQRVENGGPGLGGEKLIKPEASSPGQVSPSNPPGEGPGQGSQTNPQPEGPAQPPTETVPPPGEREGQPPEGGSQESTPPPQEQRPPPTQGY
jgi:general secretion pathway protein D